MACDSKENMKKTKVPKYDHVNMSVFDLVPSNSLVLDVGCWNGSLGKALIRKKQCIVDGIDNHKIALAEAKSNGYRKLYVRDLNRGEYTIPSEKYDCIVYADVLEHVLFPEEVLRKFTKYLKPSGVIVVSMPNIGFLYYRLKLLVGNFDYKEVGVMDKTHLKLYTLKTMRELFKAGGYKEQRMVLHNEVAPQHGMLHWLKYVWPTLFTLQFVFLLKPLKK